MTTSKSLSLGLAVGLAFTLAPVSYAAPRVSPGGKDVASTQATFKLTPESIKAQYEALVKELPKLKTSADWKNHLSRWNSLKAFLSGEGSRRDYRESQNTVDPKAEADSKFMREEISPICEPYDAQLREAMLKSPFRADLEKHFGKLLFVNFEVAQSGYDPANIKLNTEIGNLVARYNKLTGSARVTVDGEEMTLPKAGTLLDHPDEAKRKSAWLAIGQWQVEHGGELHDLYSKLVALRHQSALNLHEATYVPVGYRRMVRTDYGPAEVKAFRQGIRTHVVPLLAKFRQAQAKSLGVKTLKPWNANYFPGLSLAPGILNVNEEPVQAQKLFERLHPKLAGHFRHMNQNGLIDLANRPNKRSGAFATTFDDEKKALIFCNNTGSGDDVGTLTHEMGHAFQAWESMWIEPIELRWPTYEACEIHSTGMEYLALPLLDSFFKAEDAAKYRRLRLIDTLTMLPYIATVDEYQHWVYEHPNHTPQEREAAWGRIWDSYNVGVDYSGYEAIKNTRWMRQGHIFRMPFYYIDYAIAEAGALQLFELDGRDHAKAMESYLELCQIGGTQSLLGIFKSAHLQSPFTPDLWKTLMAPIAKELEL